MGQAIMCGTDVHDKMLVSRVSVGLGEPETMKHRNTSDGRRELFGVLKRLKRENEAERMIMAYEASGQGFGLHDQAEAAGIECRVLPPTRVGRKGREHKNKNDVRDAQMLLGSLRAHVLAGNDLPVVWIPDHELRRDRELVRMRLDVGEKMTEVRTQIRCLLKRHEILKPEKAGETWSAAYCKWIESLRPEGGIGMALASLLRQLCFLEEEQKDLDKLVATLAKADRYREPAKALLKLQGVGILTTMVFLTEIGDMSRFNNRKKLGAYLGLVPTCHESGDFDNKKGHITKEGPSRVRKLLCQAAWSSINGHGPDEPVFQSIVERNPGRKKIAVVAIMRRLAIRMWHIALDAQQRSASRQKAA